MNLQNNLRIDWEESFKQMAEAGDDQLLDSEIIDHNFDEKEWEW